MSVKTSQNSNVYDFSVLHRRKPMLMASLMQDKLQPMLDGVREIEGDHDVVVFSIIPNIVDIAVGITPDFMDFVLNNDNLFAKPDAGVVMEIFGGPGILSMSPTSEGEPYQRREARDLVNKFFTRHLKTKAFASTLHDIVLRLVYEFVQHPNATYDQLMKYLRLEYLRQLYLSNSISDRNMMLVYVYTSRVFGAALSLFTRKPLKNLLGRTWHEMTPRSMKSVQAQAEDILIGVIDERLAQDDYGDDFFGEMIARIQSHWELNSHEMKLEIISGFLQILFASADTTASAVGSLLKVLGENPEKQAQLRIHARNLVSSKSNGIIDYDDFMMTDNPDSAAIHRFVGQILVDHPPTPVTARQSNADIHLTDGTVIRKGTNIFLDLSQIQSRTGHDPQSSSDLMNLRIFGGGKTKCIGRPSAIFELFVTTIQFLNHTHNIEVTNLHEINRVVGGTLRHEGMKLNIELAGNS